MATHTELDVQLIGATQFIAPMNVDFGTDATGGQALAEFAGRACYETFNKPNPRTASNEAYLNHIMEVGHTAVLEHATATLYIRGISRSATHELVRHRHFSFSQLSQRYVQDEAHVVVPPAIADDEQMLHLFDQAVDEAHFAWQELLKSLSDTDSEGHPNPNKLLRTKQARQAARAILPNCTESRIVVTGNYRAWRHFIAVRATEHADTEIRAVAIRCLEILRELAPAVFGDFEITRLGDGTFMASSPYANDF